MEWMKTSCAGAQGMGDGGMGEGLEKQLQPNCGESCLEAQGVESTF